MTMDIMSISNEKIGEIVKNNPNMMMYFELTNQMKGFADAVENIKADMDILNSKINKYDDNFENIEKNTNEIHSNLSKVYTVQELITSDLSKVKDEQNTLLKFTNTLEFTGRDRELFKKVHSKVYKVNGRKESLEHTLFHQTLTAQIWNILKEFYGISRYGLIPDDSFDECVKMVERWRPETNYKDKIMVSYRKRVDIGNLPVTLHNAYDKYLEKTGGIFK